MPRRDSGLGGRSDTPDRTEYYSAYEMDRANQAQDGHVRFAYITGRRSGLTRWLVGYMARRRRSSAAAVVMQSAHGVCFGPLDEGHQFALRSLAAGGDPPARGPIGERTDHHGTDPIA
jgi:hypothetical protein